MTALESLIPTVPLEPPPAFPLSPTQLERIRVYGGEERVAPGEVLYSPGDEDWGMFVVLEGRVDIVERYRLPGMRVVVSYEPGEFTGEIGMLTRRRSTLTATVVGEGGRRAR